MIANKSKAEKGFGARPLNRIILLEIENRIAEMIVNDEVSSGDEILISIENDKIECRRACLALN